MTKTTLILCMLVLSLAGCSTPPLSPAAPEPVRLETPTVVTPAITPTPTITVTPTPPIEGKIFLKISRSTDVFHLSCDPLEIIFDVTVNSTQVKDVIFFFRLKDKATGLVNSWSNGENMRPAGSGVFEFIFRASAIPTEARYKDAWVQYQFVGVDRNLRILGQSQIYAKELTFTLGCS